MLCGEDCAGQPRVKDKRGRYYCPMCYDKAVEQVRADQTSAQIIGSSSGGATTVADDSPLRSMINEGDDVSTAVGAARRTCTVCGQPVDPAWVLCTNCGFNLRSGEALEPTKLDAPLLKIKHVTIWPAIVGMISVALGAFSALTDLLLMGSGFSAVENSGGESVFIAIARPFIAAVPLLVSAWLCVAGAGLLMRRSWAADTIRKWAVVKLLLSLIGAGILGVLFLTGRLEALTPPTEEISPQAFLIVISIALGLMIAWPIFVMLWFGREKVQLEAAGW